jgi:hypothetical protein
MDDMCIPYLAPFSYRELIVSIDKETSAQRIVEAYTRIAANMQKLAASGTSLREGKPTVETKRSRVILLAASNDEALCAQIDAHLSNAGFEPLTLGTRPTSASVDLSQQFRDVQCVVAIVTPAFAESAIAQTLLQLATDLAKPIIPAVFEQVSHMPLLLSDKKWVDCMGNLDKVIPRVVEAVKAAGAPRRRQLTGVAKVYLSYSHHDADFAIEAMHYLVGRGYSVWLDREIRPG